MQFLNHRQWSLKQYNKCRERNFSEMRRRAGFESCWINKFKDHLWSQTYLHVKCMICIKMVIHWKNHGSQPVKMFLHKYFFTIGTLHHLPVSGTRCKNLLTTEWPGELMSQMYFKVAYLWYAGWNKTLWLALPNPMIFFTNQSVLFQRSYSTLKFVYYTNKINNQGVVVTQLAERSLPIP